MKKIIRWCQIALVVIGACGYMMPTYALGTSQSHKHAVHHKQVIQHKHVLIRSVDFLRMCNNVMHPKDNNQCKVLLKQVTSHSERDDMHNCYGVHKDCKRALNSCMARMGNAGIPTHCKNDYKTCMRQNHLAAGK